jgi:hypothetical protein
MLNPPPQLAYSLLRRELGIRAELRSALPCFRIHDATNSTYDRASMRESDKFEVNCSFLVGITESKRMCTERLLDIGMAHGLIQN